MNQYDDPGFFNAYARMSRSQLGLEGAGVNQQFAKDGYWPVDDYFYSGERITDFLGFPVRKYHHTLTQIMNGLLQAGFVIEAVEEAMPPEPWREQMPDEMRRPMMLLVKARKAG